MKNLARMKLLVLPLIVVLLFSAGTLYASASSTSTDTGTVRGYYMKETTFYLKQESFAYLNPYMDYGNVAGVLGPGEKVKVYGKYVFRSNSGTSETYYEIKFMGKSCYIKASDVTTKKPKYSYSIKLTFRSIDLKRSVRLRSKPSSSSSSFVYTEGNLRTIGETKNWYKVYVDGHVWFLKKSNSAIKSVSTAKDPVTTVSKIASAQQTNVRKRATYIYNMLPQSVIKQIEKDGVKITITSVFSNTTMEDGGYSGYWRGPNEIYLKEKDNYRLEYSLLHEIGHYLTYYKITGDANGIAGYFYNSCYSEADLLGLKEYYTSEKDEYAAEAFKYYVLNPKKLKKEAENTYNFIEKEILGISD